MENSSDLRAYREGRRQHPPLPQPDDTRENCNTIQFRCLKRIQVWGGRREQVGPAGLQANCETSLHVSPTHTHSPSHTYLWQTNFIVHHIHEHSDRLVVFPFQPRPHPHPSPPQLAKILTRKLFKCFVLSGLMNSSPRQCLG